VLRFVRALPKPTTTAVTRVQEVTKVSFLEVFAVAELMHERTLTQQTHYHLIWKQPTQHKNSFTICPTSK